ncbi:MAG TPA: ATP-binding protein [Polyangiaceae bacterium LLY-WYZ-15_(1-7)]|nr:ATP-binding protein [Polyangiaceae bacterium LLY-WYZ-15_(1-7)]
MAEAAEKLTIEAAPDFIISLTKCRPIRGVEELVWNALDADAKVVEIILNRNDLDGIESILVKDDGHGIDRDDRSLAFGQLGGSPKSTRTTTPAGRELHGRDGKGRLRALGLGGRASWKTRFRDTEGNLFEWSARASADSPRVVAASEVVELDAAGCTGTAVLVENLEDGVDALAAEGAARELLSRLAVYLRKYPSIRVTYDGTVLDPAEAVEVTRSYAVEVEVAPGKSETGEVTVVEWKQDVPRKLYLCGSGGMARHEMAPGIHAKGYSFTAYLSSPLFASMSEGDMKVAKLRGDVTKLVEAAKDALREHFRIRERERAESLISEWKAEGVYPYPDTPAATPIEEVEREVFDICAISISDRLTGFEKSDTSSKKLTMRLVRQALETSPSSLQTIMREVLNLTKEQQDDLADLLQRTRLSAIISAARLVTDRLTFLGALEDLVFHATSKKLLRERSQLQKILVNELWVFGQEYDLGHDDKNLKHLLNAHSKILGREAIEEEVLDINGEESLPDLMLYRQFPLREPDEFEHLVVELKRPSVKVGKKEIDQIEEYAFSVASDPRFDKTKTDWKFVVVSGDLTSFAKEKVVQKDREWGHIHRGDRVNVYVSTWARVIQTAKWKYDLYRQRLQVEVDDEHTRRYLAEKHGKYVPSKILDAISPAEEVVPPAPPAEDPTAAGDESPAPASDAPGD